MNNSDSSDNIETLFSRVDKSITHWMARNGVTLLRVSLGIVYFWFGLLKYFPDLSPAESLASRTISVISFGLISSSLAMIILATWEGLIGLGLITGKFLRATLLLLAVQMIGAIMPVFLFPSEVFNIVPYAPTLEGQYIIKNLVLISAAIVIGATVRGGRLIADPEAAEEAVEEEETKVHQKELTV